MLMLLEMRQEQNDFVKQALMTLSLPPLQIEPREVAFIRACPHARSNY